MLDVVQNISLPEEEKNLAARLPEVRPIYTFHMKQLEYLENVQRIGQCFEENNDKRIIAAITVYFQLDIAVRALDIALGNHALRAHRLVNNL